MGGFRRLRETARGLSRCRQMVLFLAAFFVYSDGIGTTITMATAHGSQIGPGTDALSGALLVIQTVGAPFTFVSGALADRIGTRNAIMLALAEYSGISVFGYFVTEAWHFRVPAPAVGMVQGEARRANSGGGRRANPGGGRRRVEDAAMSPAPAATQGL